MTSIVLTSTTELGVFLNKLMNLARRHGHDGRRAVYVKKFEGRQGLETQDFQKAITLLIEHGVLDQEGEMLFINDDWDRHRYDGKSHEGMPSYEDKREFWDPVLEAVSQAIG